MPYKLIVVHEFHGYPKGAVITDQAEVAQLLDEHEARVVKVVLSDAEAAALAPVAPPAAPAK